MYTYLAFNEKYQQICIVHTKKYDGHSPCSQESCKLYRAFQNLQRNQVQKYENLTIESEPDAWPAR